MSNQPKVPTRTNNSHLKKEKIRRVLKNFPEGLNPKTIAAYTQINVNTVKTLLHLMPDVKKKEGLRGYYVLVGKDLYGFFDYKIQNLHFVYESESIVVEKRISEVNSLDDFIKFRFSVGKHSKKASMSVGSDYSLDLSCLPLLVYTFKNLVEKNCGLRPANNEVFLKTFEVNKDYFNLGLEGCSFMRVDTLLAQLKIYHKNKSFVRQELKIKIPIGFDTVLKMLEKGLAYAESDSNIKNLRVKMESFEKKISKLDSTVRRLFDLKGFNDK